MTEDRYSAHVFVFLDDHNKSVHNISYFYRSLSMTSHLHQEIEGSYRPEYTEIQHSFRQWLLRRLFSKLAANVPLHTSVFFSIHTCLVLFILAIFHFLASFATFSLAYSTLGSSSPLPETNSPSSSPSTNKLFPQNPGVVPSF